MRDAACVWSGVDKDLNGSRDKQKKRRLDPAGRQMAAPSWTCHTELNRRNLRGQISVYGCNRASMTVGCGDESK